MSDSKKAKNENRKIRFSNKKMKEKTMMNKIRNNVYRTKLKVKPVIHEGQMSWFGHINQMYKNISTRKHEV